MRKISLLFGVALLVTPALACAQSNGAETSDGHYSYRFDDDPLGAVPGGAWSDWFKGHTRRPRSTLIRPRVQFVPELLKSSENI